jgi:hypothetical protein
MYVHTYAYIRLTDTNMFIMVTCLGFKIPAVCHVCIYTYMQTCTYTHTIRWHEILIVHYNEISELQSAECIHTPFEDIHVHLRLFMYIHVHMKLFM